ncbi:Rho guanine nucleotide exchange factor 8-like protein [Tanacetum coccineum]
METYPRRCYVLMYNYSKEKRDKRVKVPPGGLSDESRKWMHHQKDCCSQVLKASIAINAQVLSEMEIPETYIDALPKVRQVQAIAFYGFHGFQHSNRESILLFGENIESSSEMI